MFFGPERAGARGFAPPALRRDARHLPLRAPTRHVGPRDNVEGCKGRDADVEWNEEGHERMLRRLKGERPRRRHLWPTPPRTPRLGCQGPPGEGGQEIGQGHGVDGAGEDGGAAAQPLARGTEGCGAELQTVRLHRFEAPGAGGGG